MVTHEQQELGTALGAELLRQAQLWQRAPHWGISLPSFKSSVRADQLERDPLPARACDYPPSRGGGRGGRAYPWPPGSMAVQSSCLAVCPHPALPPTPCSACQESSRQGSATSTVSSQQSTFLCLQPVRDGPKESRGCTPWAKHCPVFQLSAACAQCSFPRLRTHR